MELKQGPGGWAWPGGGGRVKGRTSQSWRVNLAVRTALTCLVAEKRLKQASLCC